jgi:hypothetical protein
MRIEESNPIMDLKLKLKMKMKMKMLPEFLGQLGVFGFGGRGGC